MVPNSPIAALPAISVGRGHDATCFCKCARAATVPGSTLPVSIMRSRDRSSHLSSASARKRGSASSTTTKFCSSSSKACRRCSVVGFSSV